MVTSNTRVCSTHFKETDFAKTTSIGTETQVRRLVAGVVPSVFAWNANAPSKPTRRVLIREHAVEADGKKRAGRSIRTVSESPVVTDACAGINPGSVVDQSTPAPYLEHDYLKSQLSATFVQELVGRLESRAEELEWQMRHLRLRSVSLESLKGNDKLFKHYTGLPKFSTFEALVRYLTPKARRLRWWRGLVTRKRLLFGVAFGKQGDREYQPMKLSIAEQFFAVLVRLRRAASVQEMAQRNDMSNSSFSKLFTTWMNFLAYELRDLHRVPATKPRVLIKSFLKFPHTRVIIDCTEVFSQRPSGLHARKQLFSNYKHHTTSKFLVGIAPSGAINYVSNMWGGRASDKKSL